MKLYVKNMVCNRCIMVIKSELENMKMVPLNVSMGEVELQKEPSEKQIAQFSERIKVLGFELLNDQKRRQIEKIKKLIIGQIQSGEIPEHFVLSEYLSKALNKEYSFISRLFSEVEGTTLEQYFIMQKIEKVKEYIVYDEMNINEIAYKLGYSSSAHLSAQFKKATGLTPSHFKKTGVTNRKSIDSVKD